VKEVNMSRFTFRSIVILTLFALLLSACSVMDLLPQSAPPAAEAPTPEETAPEEAAPAEAEAAPAEPEAVPHGDTPEETTPVAEAQVITPENAHLLKEVAQVQIENPYRLVWSQDGTQIGMLAQSGMSILDGVTLETLSTVVVQEPITVLDFSPTTGLMATTSDQENLDLREITTGQLVRTITPEHGFIDAVFSTDGSQVALSSWDKIAVTLWDTANGTQVKELSGFATAAPVYHASYSGDDRYLIWVARGSAQVMDISSGALGAHLTHEDFIGDAELAPNGHLLAVTTAGTIDGESRPIIQLWDQTSGQALGTLVEGTSITQSLAFNTDGKLLVVSVFNELALWDVDAKARLLALPGHTDIVTSIAFSPDGRTLVSASADGTVRLWQTQ
jgi:WD40 repeat protein